MLKLHHLFFWFIYLFNTLQWHSSKSHEELESKRIDVEFKNNSLYVTWINSTCKGGFGVTASIKDSQTCVDDSDNTKTTIVNGLSLTIHNIYYPATTYNISINCHEKKDDANRYVFPYNYTIFKTSPIAPIIKITNTSCNDDCSLSIKVKDVQFSNSSLYIFAKNETSSATKQREKILKLVYNNKTSSSYGMFTHFQRNISSLNSTTAETKTNLTKTIICSTEITLIAVNNYRGEMKYAFEDPKFDVDCNDVKEPKPHGAKFSVNDVELEHRFDKSNLDAESSTLRELSCDCLTAAPTECSTVCDCPTTTCNYSEFTESVEELKCPIITTDCSKSTEEPMKSTKLTTVAFVIIIMVFCILSGVLGWFLKKKTDSNAGWRKEDSNGNEDNLRLIHLDR